MKPSEPLPSAGECRKYGFASKHAALQAVISQAQKHGHRRRSTVYKCPDCHAWHTSSPTEAGRRPWKATRRGARTGGRPGESLPVDVAFARLAELNEERIRNLPLPTGTSALESRSS